MKLLLATGLYPPDIGGPATYAVMLEEELPKRDIDVAVLPFAEVRGYPKLVRHFIYGWKLWQAAAQADVVYALDPVSVGVPAAVVARLRRRPLLLRLGGDYAWEQGTERFGVTQLLDDFVRTRQRSWRVRLLQRLQTWVAKRARAVVVPSQYLGRVIEQWGVEDNKIKVIYSVPHLATIAEGKQEIRDSLGLSGTVLLSAGRLVPWKGFAELISIVGEIKNTIPDFHLYIAGGGSERSKLEEIITTLGLTDTVTLLGSLPHEELLRYKTASDVYVLNTSYEGFSHDLLETMTLGTPVVTTTAGGNVELINDLVEGLLVPPGDSEALQAALLQALQNPELRTRLAQHAKIKAASFTTKKSLARLESLLSFTSHHEKSTRTSTT